MMQIYIHSILDFIIVTLDFIIDFFYIDQYNNP